MKNFNCGLCDSQSFTQFHSQIDKYEQPVYLSVCNKCGLRQLNPRKDDNELKDFYSSKYYALYAMDEKKQNRPNWIHKKESIAESILDAIEIQRPLKGIRLLDIGCGYGFLIKLAQQRGTITYGIEASEKHAEELKKAGFNIFAGSFQQYIAGNPDVFDVITLSHVLEHVAKPREFLVDVLQLLEPNGLLAVEVPNISWQSVHGRYPLATHSAHIYYFTEQTLQALFKISGLTTMSTLYGRDGAYLRLIATPGSMKKVGELDLPIDTPENVIAETRDSLRRLEPTLHKRIMSWIAQKIHSLKRNSKTG